MKKEKFDFVRIVIEKKEANGNFEITNAFEVDIDTYEKDIEGSNLEKYISTLDANKRYIFFHMTILHSYLGVDELKYTYDH